MRRKSSRKFTFCSESVRKVRPVQTTPSAQLVKQFQVTFRGEGSGSAAAFVLIDELNSLTALPRTHKYAAELRPFDKMQVIGLHAASQFLTGTDHLVGAGQP